MQNIKRQTKKITVSIVGFSITTIGLIMLVTPGPGWLFIILGLGILATEYIWAHKLLEKVKVYYKRTKHKTIESIKRKS